MISVERKLSANFSFINFEDPAPSSPSSSTSFAVQPAPFRHSLDRGRTHLKIPITVARSRGGRRARGMRGREKGGKRKFLPPTSERLRGESDRGERKRVADPSVRVSRRPDESPTARKRDVQNSAKQSRLIRAAVPRVSQGKRSSSVRTRVTGRRLKGHRGPPRSRSCGDELLSSARLFIHFSLPRQCQRTYTAVAAA